MYKKGDMVVHPGQGVCVVDEVDADDAHVYILTPVNSENITLKTPISLEDKLRPILSKAEATKLISEFESLETVKHKEHSLIQEERYFKDQIRHGSCKEVLQIAITYAKKSRKLESNNKRAPVAYDRIFRTARDRAFQELACALKKDIEQISEQFMEYSWFY